MRRPLITIRACVSLHIHRCTRSLAHSRHAQPRHNGDPLVLPRGYYHRPVRRRRSEKFDSSLTHYFSGKKRRDTVLTCLSSDDVEEGRIQMNKVARNNLRVKLGDLVNVHQCLDIRYGKRMHILPFDDSIEGLSGNIFDVYIKPYFLEGEQSCRSLTLFGFLMITCCSLSTCAQRGHFPCPWKHASCRIQSYGDRPSSILYSCTRHGDLYG